MTKTNALFACMILFAIHSYAQIKFEKGYFITNEGTKTECFIKNMDWENAPSELNFQRTQNGTTENVEIQKIKEFGIDNFSRYIKVKTKIDTSQVQLNELTKNKEPEWADKEIMLQVLIDGKASLYQYKSKKLNRFFFKTKETEIQQLVFKEYMAELPKEENITEELKKNTAYKQQLIQYVVCNTSSIQKINNLKFYKSNLLKYFRDYNKCVNEPVNDYESKKKRNFLNLSIRPGVDLNKLTFFDGLFEEWNADFSNVAQLRIGAELEVVLPFNKNKWSIIIEPTYSSLKIDDTTLTGEEATVDYKSIEIPIGMRHRFFLTDNANLYVNISGVLSKNLNSNVLLDRREFVPEKDLKLDNIAYGIGYAYKKFSVEVRYYSPKDILYGENLISSEISKTSFILGYQIF